jgi:hypothetical protein
MPASALNGRFNRVRVFPPLEQQSPLTAASATFALKAGVRLRRGRLAKVFPDSQASACLPSGRNSAYRPAQISGTRSTHAAHASEKIDAYSMLSLHFAMIIACIISADNGSGTTANCGKRASNGRIRVGRR